MTACTERAIGHKLLSMIQKLSPTDNHLQVKNYFSPKGSLREYKAIPKGKPYLCAAVNDQQKMNSVQFCEFFIICHFFLYTSFAYLLWFWFCLLMVFLVCQQWVSAFIRVSWLFLWLFYFCLFVLSYSALTIFNFILLFLKDFCLCSIETEKRYLELGVRGSGVGIWEELGEGNHNQIYFMKKINLQLKK